MHTGGHSRDPTDGQRGRVASRPRRSLQTQARSFSAKPCRNLTIFGAITAWQ